VDIRGISLDSEVEIRALAALLFGSDDSWDWNVANNTSLFTGRHVACFDSGRLIAYADCLPCGVLMQSAGDPDLAKFLVRQLKFAVTASQETGGSGVRNFEHFSAEPV
jgi:hypothetical protein